MRFTGFHIITGFVVISLILAVRMAGIAQNATLHPTEILHPAEHDISPPLREMPVIQPSSGNKRGEREIPNQILPLLFRDNRSLLSSEQGIDPVLQNKAGAFLPNSTLVNIDGIANKIQISPPDPVGDIGANHYVQAVNIFFGVYSKTGTLLYGPVSFITLWQGFPGPHSCDGDPIVVYDHMADRWLIMQFSLPNYPLGPYYILVAVSQTPDPLGSWYRYSYKFSTMPDYPKLGVWTDGYYMSVNMYDKGEGKYIGPAAVVLERDSLLNGKTGRMSVFRLGVKDTPMLPADLDGPAPAKNTPGLFLSSNDFAENYNNLKLYSLYADWSKPDSSEFILTDSIAVAPFNSVLCNNSNNCIPQAGSSRKLDPLMKRLMNRLQYRNFGTYQVLMANHTVNADSSDHAGIRWYELRNTGNTWSVYQQGTYAPDANHRWIGSISMDGSGNIALGYSVSGTGMNPSIRATGRRAIDPPGQMSFMEEKIMEGGGAQTMYSRWGDYSCLTVDPVDDRTFWYTNEYYSATSNDSWKTRIASFTINNLPVSNKKYQISSPSFLLKSSPNPVVNMANITWQMKSPGHVQLSFYDFTGRKVETLVNAMTAPGNHQVVFDASAMPAGMYFCQLRVNGIIETREIIVSK